MFAEVGAARALDTLYIAVERERQEQTRVLSRVSRAHVHVACVLGYGGPNSSYCSYTNGLAGNHAQATGHSTAIEGRIDANGSSDRSRVRIQISTV